jgi:hypothetical protein
LQFASGTKKHIALLTAPKAVLPLTVDLDAMVNRPRRLSRDFALPDPSLLRMRILQLDNSMPKYEIKVTDKAHPVRTRGKPSEMVAGDTIAVKGRANVILEKDRTPKVTCQIGLEHRGKDVSLDVQAMSEVSGETFQFNTNVVQVREARANGYVMSAESPQGRNSRNPPTQQMIQAFKTASNDYKALETLITELHKQISIPFCIYVVAGAADDNAAPKVVIFQSTAEDPAAGPKKKGKGPVKGAAGN